MGWDMYARGPRGGRRPQREKFVAASKFVIAKAGSVDCLLEVSALDCSACAYALQDMTGLSAWLDWSIDDVQKAWAKAKQVKPKDIEAEPWAYWSAREFLRICAENKLKTEASY